MLGFARGAGWRSPVFRKEPIKENAMPKSYFSSAALRGLSFIIGFAFLFAFSASAQSRANVNTQTGNTANASAANPGNANATINATPTATATVTPTQIPLSEPITETDLEKAGTLRTNYVISQWWYNVLVSIVFLLVTIPFVFIIARSIKYSGSTYRSALGMPDGSIRAIIALILVVLVALYVLAGVLTATMIKPPEYLIGIVATVIGFYFGSRSEGAGESNSRGNGGVKGKVVDAAGKPVSGALVKLTRGEKFELAVPTNLTGDYEIKGAWPGAVSLQAVLDGQIPSESKAVTITGGKTEEVNLKFGA